VQYPWAVVFCSSVVFAGCSFDPGGADVNGHDGAVADSAVADAPRPADAAPDARQPDASRIDAAIVDAAPPDARLPDAAPPDASGPDASMPLPCPNGYQHGLHQNSDHCYRFVVSGKQWAAAEADCENDNNSGTNNIKPHLIVFSNEAEYADVQSQLGGLPDPNIWIGADDLASEGNFVNVTGGPFISTHFKPGEPNDGGDGPGGLHENCLLFEMRATPNPPGPGLNDVDCTQAPQTHSFLCELDGVSPQ
jgi:hypothetical protein